MLCRLKPTESCWYSLLFSINNRTRIHTDSHRLAPAFIRANPCPDFSSGYLLWPYRHAEFQAFEVAMCEQPWLVNCVDFATFFTSRRGVSTVPNVDTKNSEFLFVMPTCASRPPSRFVPQTTVNHRRDLDLLGKDFFTAEVQRTIDEGQRGANHSTWTATRAAARVAVLLCRMLPHEYPLLDPCPSANPVQSLTEQRCRPAQASARSRPQSSICRCELPVQLGTSATGTHPFLHTIFGQGNSDPHIDGK